MMQVQKMYSCKYRYILFLTIYFIILTTFGSVQARGFRIKLPEINPKLDIYPKIDLEGKWRISKEDIPSGRIHEAPMWDQEWKSIESRFESETESPKIEKLSRPLDIELSQIDYLARSVSNSPQFVSLYPTNAKTFSAAFHSPPSFSQVKGLNQLHRDLSSLPNAKEIFPVDVNDFSVNIKDSNSDIITIFGHSRAKGEEIALPSGVFVKRSELLNACRVVRKNCFILTCDGADFSIKGKLVAFHALRMHKAAIKLFKNSSENGIKVTVGDIRKEMIGARTAQVAKERIALSAISMWPFGVYMVTTEEKPKSLPGKRKNKIY